jgi:hypothetical protein
MVAHQTELLVAIRSIVCRVFNDDQMTNSNSREQQQGNKFNSGARISEGLLRTYCSVSSFHPVLISRVTKKAIDINSQDEARMQMTRLHFSQQLLLHGQSE